MYAIQIRWKKLRDAAIIQSELIRKRKQGPVWDAQEILPGIWLGSFPAAVKADELKRRNITHILSIGAEFAPVFPGEFTYMVAFAVDSAGQDIFRYFEHSVAFIDEALNSGSAILVHCHAGISRSASLVAAYLISTGGHNWNQALNSIRHIRPVVCPNNGFRIQLQSWELSVNHPERANSYRRHALSQVVLGGCLARYEKHSRRPVFIIGNYFTDLGWRIAFQALMSYGNLIAKTTWGSEFISKLL